MPGPAHIVMDIVAGTPMAPAPVVQLRGAPVKATPSLDPSQKDTIQWVNQLTSDVTIAVPWAKRAFKNMPGTFTVLAGEESEEYEVKRSVGAAYRKAFRYLVQEETTGLYAVGGSDPEIEIK